MTKIALGIIGFLLAAALIISKDSLFLTPIILCWCFVGLIEAIEKLGKGK